VIVAGVAPRHTVTPRAIDELCETIRALHDERRSFAIAGGATELSLGNAPRALDTLIRTTALDRVVEYAPEDQTITVEAGITLAALDRILAEHAQMLPIDAIDRAHATIGGVVAANSAGRRRGRYGTAKDLIVGVTIVRPDGVRARGGGKVVKNVAGFDLPKLMVGSLGTLGAIATVTLRLYPVPEASGAVVARVADDASIARICDALVACRLEPESVALYNGEALVITFAGTRAGVDAQVAATRTLAPDVTDLTELERLSYDQRESAVRRDGAWRFRLTAPPREALAICARRVSAEPANAVPVVYPLLGIGWQSAADANPREIDAARARGAVVVHAMPDAARGEVDAWGPPPPSFPLMRALKERFDPHGLCNPGRFVGGL
jgi:glycolate oxidase FAD binding subunit